METMLASREERFAATIIDLLAATVAMLPAVAPVKNAEAYVPLLGGVATLALSIIQIFFLSKDGQTIGKKAVDIKIIEINTGKNGGFFNNVLLRSLLNALLSLSLIYPLIDILFIFRKDRRCLHDLIAGTSVISIKPVPIQKPSFSIEEFSFQQGLISPSITSKLIFDAIKIKDINMLQYCMLTEQEFNELNIENGSISEKFSKDIVKQIATYNLYKKNITDKFSNMILMLDSYESFSNVILDNISEIGETRIKKSKVIDGVEMFISLTDYCYATKKIKIQLLLS